MKVYPQIHIGAEDQVEPGRTWRNAFGTLVTIVKVGDVQLVGEPQVLEAAAIQIAKAACQAAIDGRTMKAAS